MSFKVNQEIAVCGGKVLKLSHFSQIIGASMDVNVYLPKQYYSKEVRKLIPVIYYLSGLTCSPQNASEKAFGKFSLTITDLQWSFQTLLLVGMMCQMTLRKLGTLESELVSI